jgi:2-dehydropantoate 2-reductase
MGFPDSPEGISSSYPDEFMALTRSQYTDPSNTHMPSMLLDAQKGLPIEVEVILGEVVRLAREFKVAVPVRLR